MKFKSLPFYFGILFLFAINLGSANAQILITNVDPATVCAGDAIDVDYSSLGGFNAGNDFELQLSDDAGDFTTPTVLTTVTSTDANGTITANIPSGLTSGTAYEVRIVSTDPVFTSNTSVITINALPVAPVITAVGPTTFCMGDSVLLISDIDTDILWSNTETNDSIYATIADDYSVTVTDVNNCSSTSAIETVTVNSLPAAPVITADGATTFCMGDSVLLISDIDTDILWSNSETNDSIYVKVADDYSVTVTDANNCSSTSAIEIVTVNSLPTAPVITADGATTFCMGDSVRLISDIDTDILWNNAATEDSIFVKIADDYSVTVTDANNCTATSNIITVDVTVVTPIISADGPLVYCTGTTFSLTLTSSAADSYLWSNAATTQNIVVTTVGTYKVVVTDNGCSDSTSVTVSFFSPTASITAGGPDTFCLGGSVVLTANTADAYLWNTGATTQSITADTAGNYRVTITDQDGCTGQSPFYKVTVNPLPIVTFDLGIENSATFFAPIDTVCKDFVGKLAGGFPTVTTGTTGVYSGLGVSNGMFAAQQAGPTGNKTITYTYTDIKGCVNSANDKVYVDVCLGVENQELANIFAFPNPAQDKINIGWDAQLDVKVITIMDLTGRTIEKITVEGLSEKVVDISKYHSGLYFIRLSGDAVYKDLKVVKN